MREDRATQQTPVETRVPGDGLDPGRAAVAVELTGIAKRFGDYAAVDDVTLDVYEGEFFSLLGPSGCGKTTTLRMIAGFEEPDEGNIRVSGESVRGVPPFKRPVNTVFQSYALFPHMTVFDNVAFGLRRAKVSKDEVKRRVAEACALVRLTGFEERKPAALSGGQQQRVALARALVNRPKVLLLDEPLGALDLKIRKELQLELKNLQSEVGITFVYVTHDQEEALTMSDRIAVMDRGRVQQVAVPAELYELPSNRFVAGFIGQTNVLSGAVESVNGGRATLRTATGGLVVEATMRDGLPVRDGEEVHATVRPEKVRFGDAGDNVAAGARVEQVVYQGIATQYILELPGGEKLVLHQQNAHDATGPGVGDEVTVSWDARNCLVLGG